jgi:hypothetical protein
MNADPERCHALAEKFILFMETGTPPEGLLAPDVFCDLSLPLWRLQSVGIEGLTALRKEGHPWPGRVPRWRFDPTPTGFVLEFDEEWEHEGERWISRELMRADVGDEGITEVSVYCTGDWDAAQQARHAVEVTLLRP